LGGNIITVFLLGEIAPTLGSTSLLKCVLFTSKLPLAAGTHWWSLRHFSDLLFDIKEGKGRERKGRGSDFEIVPY